MTAAARIVSLDMDDGGARLTPLGFLTRKEREEVACAILAHRIVEAAQYNGGYAGDTARRIVAHALGVWL